MALLYDLAVYTGKSGRSRGIERYARHVGPTLEGDEAIMLRAAQTTRFCLWRISRTHEIAGLWVTDVFSRDRIWLIDEGMEATCRPGLVFAGRLMAVEDFVMTCGVAVPVNLTLLAATMEKVPNIAGRSRDDALNDPRLAICIYRSAIETGTMERLVFLRAGELAPEAMLAG
jgi:hypothetical protein